jgi:hypothetical protein
MGLPQYAASAASRKACRDFFKKGKEKKKEKKSISLNRLFFFFFPPLSDLCLRRVRVADAGNVLTRRAVLHGKASLVDQLAGGRCNHVHAEHAVRLLVPENLREKKKRKKERKEGKKKRRRNKKKGGGGEELIIQKGKERKGKEIK